MTTLPVFPWSAAPCKGVAPVIVLRFISALPCSIKYLEISTLG